MFLPENQKRLTNVSVVRLRKGGHRFELACYPNKVKAWRDKLETDLKEVLQAQCIFSHVHKGKFANKKELHEAFDTESEDKIILHILQHGEIQVTERERTVENQAFYKDVATIISEKCVNPETNRQYNISMIEKMMRDCHINLNAHKPPKQQALKVIRQLRATEGIKIAPALMEVNLMIDKRVLDKVFNTVKRHLAHIQTENDKSSQLYELLAVLEPEQYHSLEKYLNANIKDRFVLEVVGKSRIPYSQLRPPRVDEEPDRDPSPEVTDVRDPSPARSEKSKHGQLDSSDVSENNPTTLLPRPARQTKKRTQRGKKGRKARSDDWPDSSD